MIENPRSEKLQEIAARRKSSAQDQILTFSHEWNAQINQLFQDRLSQLMDQVEICVATEIDEAVAAAGYKSRRAAQEELNQLTRRLRQCRSTEEVATWLVDSTSSFCGRAALFEVIGSRIRAVRTRGIPNAGKETLDALEASLDQAPAFAQSIQELDTTVAIGSPAEISPQVAAALAQEPADKVYLIPIVIAERVAAILYATAGGGPAVDSAPLELLAHTAASAAEILGPTEAAACSPETAELISIKGVDMRAATGGSGAMPRKALEARARWFARAETSRIRLFQKTDLERGLLQRDIYKALRPQIDAARQRYQKDFVAVSPTIADYLHKELLALAHDDASLLGAEYPGSLV